MAFLAFRSLWIDRLASRARLFKSVISAGSCFRSQASSCFARPFRAFIHSLIGAASAFAYWVTCSYLVTGESTVRVLIFRPSAGCFLDRYFSADRREKPA